MDTKRHEWGGGVRNYLVVCFLLIFTMTALGAERPNILLLYVDNLGYGDLACYGNREIRTPNIDQLARDGVRCTDFYVAAASCTPSRGAILTGRHPERNGLTWQLSQQENIRGYGLPLTEKIIPQYLKPLGYATAAFGKWNLGFAAGARPTERGFDEFLGHASGNIGYYNHVYAGQNDLRRGTEPVDLSGQYSTDLFADAAIGFIRAHQAQPWFVYLPFNAPHFVSGVNIRPGEKIEWPAPAKYFAQYGWAADEPDEKKRFRAVVTALDDAIGRVLKSVDDLKLRARTVVMFISDNGAFMLKGRGLEVQSNAPLREGGVTTYEGGVRVPAIFRWPGRFKPGTVSRELLSTLDVLPMILAAAGGAAPGDRQLDGYDATTVLAGEAKSSHHALHWLWNEGKQEQWRGMREGQWKIVRRSDQSPWELYDLNSDIGEARDLAGAQPERARALAGRFEKWLGEVRADPTRGKAAKTGK